MDRPILFNTEMVKAVLDGRKTVTRRPVKIPEQWMIEDVDGVAWSEDQYGDKYKLIDKKCPFGQIGDRLYVRETWCKSYWGYTYKADYSIFNTFPVIKWKPSIHMPKVASRIFLEITSVSVERVQNITETQFLKEGFSKITKDGSLFKYGKADIDGSPGTDDYGWPWQEWEIDHKKAFGKIWDSLYQNWDKNLWVWVVEFKRVKNV